MRPVWPQERLAQVALLMQYRALAAQGGPLPSFDDVAWSAHSQNGEDGVLLYVFALVGFRTRVAVEIAAGDGIECNSANLILNHGFQALLFEGVRRRADLGRRFYARHPATRWFPPRFVEGWVTRDNVDAVVRDQMFPGVLAGWQGEIDLLSLDLDGNDYWVLERLTCIRPRVVVVEFNAVWGARRAVSVPYDPRFRADLGQQGGRLLALVRLLTGRRSPRVPSTSGPIPYAGASLPAFVKLLGGRDYRLVGVEPRGFNAVFVRNDLATDLLPGVSAESCLLGPIVRICQAALAADPRLTADVLSRPWVEVAG